MRGLLVPARLPAPTSFALLVMRVVVGPALVLHGWPKLAAPFEWMQEFGLPPEPGILQLLAVISEVGGGIAITLGLATRVAALGVAGVMVFAIKYHLAKGDAFVAQAGSFELPAVYLTIAIVLLAAGPGGVSVDQVLFGRSGPDAVH